MQLRLPIYLTQKNIILDFGYYLFYLSIHFTQRQFLISMIKFCLYLNIYLALIIQTDI